MWKYRKRGGTYELKIEDQIETNVEVLKDLRQSSLVNQRKTTRNKKSRCARNV